MKDTLRYLNFHVTAFIVAMALVSPAYAAGPTLDQLFDELAEPEQEGWQRIEDAIWLEWSKSGSPSMDLLLKQGRDALEREDYDLALGHLTALIDHAPDFAEGYNARATTYFQMDQYGPAMMDIRRTLELNPRHFAALTGLAVILEQMGREDEALDAYREVMRLHPHRPNVAEAVERLELAVLGKRI
ncbi:tetratricopeptide repeat protein [Vannielia sp.]|uniref:tetratricopeptide repeat protein n=1 Tax=Vannielia sp. TaxID=2813045 RepID=UPI00262F40C4|nr:tetratricopeptide repeat protein [Vannielia sp.]MDF1871675.1 tetratricopeptide repeat protein [Vannielia sp.]